MNRRSKMIKAYEQFGDYNCYVVYLDDLPVGKARSKEALALMLGRLPGATWRGFMDCDEAESVFDRGPGSALSTEL
jgi:hypothetical protein